MRQRTVSLLAALVLLTGCASATQPASPAQSVADTPDLTPSQPPVASPSATVLPSGARITVFKSWDADGNAATTNDHESFPIDAFPAGAYPLEFELDVEAGGGAEPTVTTVEPKGDEQMVFQIESDEESLMVSLTEIRKDDSSLVGGHCFDTGTQQIGAGIQSDTVTFELPTGASFGCIFINTPLPDVGAGN